VDTIKITTIDEYLAQLTPNERQELQRMRDIIRSIIPEVKERISYGICVFSTKKDIVGFASQKDHLSFYTMSPPLVNTMKDDLNDVTVSGATIHFTPQKPIPTSLIRKILKERIKEITQPHKK